MAGMTRSPTVHARWRAALWLLPLPVVVAAYWTLLPLESRDMRFFIEPWFATIVHDGFPAMAGEYANYSPPYLYLLGLASLFQGLAPPIVLIKAVSILFTLLAAAAFGLILLETGAGRQTALICACLFPLIPTVAINAAWWGQCDVIYTTFLLCAFLASLRRRPLWVMLFFSIGFAFKAQAVFFAPYLLYLLLRKEIAWKYLAVVPLVYAAMMIPAWLAGRPMLQLAAVYMHQGSSYRVLAANAPNPWALIEKYHLLPYLPAVLAGLAIAALANLALVIKALSSRLDDIHTRLLLLASTTLAGPYLLPKMHDRYFFLADIFTILLAILAPRYRLTALAMQGASLAAYLAFLKGPFYQSDKLALLGALLTSVALLSLLRTPGFLGARPGWSDRYCGAGRAAL
jgi:Gpi18-like mannosyltransferase